jgi:hypothetical protein
VTDALENFKGIDYPSNYSIFRDKTARHVPPGLFKAWMADLS